MILYCTLELHNKIPLVMSDEVVAPNASYEFHLDYGPIYAGDRSATVSIAYNGTKTFSFTVVGRGRPAAATQFSHGTEVFSKIWGGYGNSQDEMPSAMVTDAAGDIYFAGNGKSISGDSFYYDIFIAKVDSAGDLVWQMRYSSEWDDRMKDPGQNDESGGSAQSLAIDPSGNIYLTASVGNGANSSYLGLVMKIDPDDGAEIWRKYWFPDTARLTYTDAADPYGIIATADSVLLTGVARDNTIGQVGVFVANLNPADGAHRWSRLIDPSPGYNDRGFSIALAPNGSLNIGGWYGSGDTGFACQLNYTTTDATVTWAKTVAMGSGSNLNCVSTDASSNIYFSADRRGASTYFSIIKLAADGSFSAGKTFTGASGDNHATKVVKVVGDSVYLGGRYSYPGLDTASGDALLLKLSAADLSYQWGGLYYTGVGPATVCEHHIKGISVLGDNLVLFGQVYTGSMNYHRYFGHWYNATVVDDVALEDYAPSIADVSVSAQVMVNAGLVTGSTNGGVYESLSGYNIEYQDATAKNADTNGVNTDGDIFLMKLNMQP